MILPCIFCIFTENSILCRYLDTQQKNYTIPIFIENPVKLFIFPMMKKDCNDNVTD